MQILQCSQVVNLIAVLTVLNKKEKRQLKNSIKTLFAIWIFLIIHSIDAWVSFLNIEIFSVKIYSHSKAVIFKKGF